MLLCCSALCYLIKSNGAFTITCAVHFINLALFVCLFMVKQDDLGSEIETFPAHILFIFYIRQILLTDCVTCAVLNVTIYL